MSSACAAAGFLVLEKWEFLGHPLPWCAAAELLPVVGEVGLVEVAACHRGLSQAGRRAGSQESAGLAEPQDPGHRLGGQAELGAGELAKMGGAQAHLLGGPGD